MAADRPRFPLLAPPLSPFKGPFRLRAKSASVARDCEGMGARIPKATQSCYEHLANDPYRRIQGRVFPLRGSVSRGFWEYEVTGSERLYYLPDAQREPEMADWQPEKEVGTEEGTADRGAASRVSERICLVFRCGGHQPPPRR